LENLENSFFVILNQTTWQEVTVSLTLRFKPIPYACSYFPHVAI